MREIELYKYNPDQSSPEEREATLVGRHEMLRGILDDLRAGAKSQTNQHFLLVGPRGSGKTHVLLMIRDRVKADRELADAYLPIRTAEEEYSITSLRDLLATLLGIASKATSDAELTNEAQAVTSESNDEAATELAIAALKAYSARSGRKLLLLIDNLDLVVGDQISDKAEIGRLRDLLMNESFLVLIGAAPTHFEEVSCYDEPLYNFFRLIEINELSFEQVTELLRKRAEWDENSDLLARLDELGGRIRAIYHLTGGNPRLVLMLYQLYVCCELPEVQASIKALLDDLTPYYKARMETLAPQQRRVMDSFARLGRPATQTELAKVNRLKANQMTSIIGRLQEAGFVSVAPQKRRKTTLYMVSERLFRIWHQMRYSSAGRRRLEFLIQFLRIWYTAEEWAKETGRLMGEYRKAAAERQSAEAGRALEHLEYLAEAAPRPELGYVIFDRIVGACIEARNYGHAEELLRQLIAESEGTRNALRLAQAWYMMAHLRDKQGRTVEEIEALAKAIAARGDFVEALGALGSALAKVARISAGRERDRLYCEACDKYRRAIEIKPDEHWAFNNWGVTLCELASMKTGEERDRLCEEAFDKYRAAVEIKPDLHEAFTNWGTALQEMASTKTGEQREQLYIEACDRHCAAIRIKPNCHQGLYNWGNALGDLAAIRTGEERDRLYQEACDKYRAAIEINPDFGEALNNWGNALDELASTKTGEDRDKLCQEAFDKYRAAIEISPDFDEALYNWGCVLSDLAATKTGEERDRLYQEAFDKYRAAIEINAKKHEALYNWGNDLERLAATKTGDKRDKLLQEACDRYRAAVEIKPDKHEALNNWGYALGELAATKTGEERDQMYEEACDKLRTAVEVKPDKHEALNNWTGVLAAMAASAEGRRQEVLFEDAAEKLAKAVELASQGSDSSSVALYSAHGVHISLQAVASSVGAQNLGRARQWFARTLQYMPQAKPDLTPLALVAFFSQVTREETAAFCEELLGIMLKGGLEPQVALLEPFAIAIEYWRRGKDAEVLDRLNPEVRELVEQIIQPRSA